jgi:hypothetical protein
MKATEQIAHTRNRLKSIMEFKRPQGDVRPSPQDIQRINSANTKEIASKICEILLSEAAGNSRIKSDIIAIGKKLGFDRITESTPPKPAAPQQASAKPKASEMKTESFVSVEKFKAGLLQVCEAFAMTMSYVAHAGAASAIAIGGSELLVKRLAETSRPNGSGEIAQWLGIGAQETTEIGMGLLAGVNAATIIVPTLAAVYWLYKRWANEKSGEHL